MRPFEIAAKVHAAVPLFREQRDAVRAFARHLSTDHLVPIDSKTLGPEAVEGLKHAHCSPAEFSEQILSAIFGAWPPSDGPVGMPKVSLPAGPIVQELPWQEWERAAAELDQSQINPPSGPAGG